MNEEWWHASQKIATTTKNAKQRLILLLVLRISQVDSLWMQKGDSSTTHEKMKLGCVANADAANRNSSEKSWSRLCLGIPLSNVLMKIAKVVGSREYAKSVGDRVP